MRFTPNVCCTSVQGKLTALRDQLFVPLAAERSHSLDLTLEDLAVLELFCHDSEPANVFENLQGRSYATAAADLAAQIAAADRGRRLERTDRLRLFLGKNRVVAVPVTEGFDAVDPTKAVDLSRLSREDPRVATALFAEHADPVTTQVGKSEELVSFLERVARLLRDGLLVPDVGTLDWGDLRRRHPLCHAFGYTRGTPIDRYYLGKYINEIRGQVRGRVLEVGGKVTNRTIYGFDHAVEYRTLDLEGGADDIGGDASDPTVVPESRFDSIVAFHVLEHCESPHTVIDNFWRWLAPGGVTFVAAPAAQKIHRFPVDCWRPQPDGMRSLFRRFSDVQLRGYGSLVTVIASLCGIAAEELSAGELDDSHPDYPVLVCVKASK